MENPSPLERIALDLKWTVEEPALLNVSDSVGAGDLIDSKIETTPEFQRFFENEPRSHRVGYYFESLVHFWLREIQGMKIVEHGLQIQDGNRTIGELDFVFRDHAGNLNHWEVAVKFYLHSKTPNQDGSHFIGPNARDTLERKHSRFLEHQLPLGRKSIEGLENQNVFVKGQIFYHPGDEDPVVSPLLSPNHLRGTWIRHSELDWLASIGESARFRILRKPYWLSGSDDACEGLETTCTVLNEHFGSSDHPVLLSAVDDEGKELKRIFVVYERWPDVN